MIDRNTRNTPTEHDLINDLALIQGALILLYALVSLIALVGGAS